MIRATSFRNSGPAASPSRATRATLSSTRNHASHRQHSSCLRCRAKNGTTRFETNIRTSTYDEAFPEADVSDSSSGEEVAKWAELLLVEKGLGGENAEVLRKQGVTGNVLFKLTEAELIAPPYSLTHGVARTLVTAIKQLRLLVRLAVDPERLKFLQSPSLDQIYLPPNTARKFCYAGPIDFREHYAVPSFLRADNLSRVANDPAYLVLHEQSQSGKTSYLLDLRDYLNSQGEYAVLYINVKQSKVAPAGLDEGMRAILSELVNQCANTFGTDFGVTEHVATFLAATQFGFALEHISRTLHRQQKKFVLLIDEMDSLTGDTLLSTLIRSNGFPHALMLVGVRDVRDCLSDDQKTGLQGRRLYIARDPQRLASFTIAHVAALVKQHNTANPEQQFDESAIAALMDVTDGQPWCVNRLCAEAVATVKDRVIKADDIRRATQAVILCHETPVDQLPTILSEARVRRVLKPMLSGGRVYDITPDDDQRYLKDLGLLKGVDGYLKFSNKIYEEVIRRILVNQQQ